MKRLFFIVLLIFLGLTGLQAQSAESPRKLRTLSEENSPSEKSCSNKLTTLRIELGKIWINGNLAKESEIPQGLRNLRKDFSYQATVFGQADLQFSHSGTHYQVKNGRILELGWTGSEAGDASSASTEESLKSDYYNHLKQQAPNIFYNLNREAFLHDQILRLQLDYELADPKSRQRIAEEIRLLLGQLFDIQLHNLEEEIRRVEAEIEAAKQDVEYRKLNKTKILDKHIQDLLR